MAKVEGIALRMVVIIILILARRRDFGSTFAMNKPTK